MVDANKALIFDSGAIITLALNDLLFILEPLKEAFGGEFFITPQVKSEIIDTPINSKRFALEALMIKSLVDKKILTVVSSPELKKETSRVLEMANSAYLADNERMRIIHDGEASCIALFNLINSEKKAIVVDERTTRMLCESPENLHRLYEKKLHRKIAFLEKNAEMFKSVKVIRTSELSLMAYNRGIISLSTSRSEAIRAILYAVKFKGCSISVNEIETARRIA
ncbi:MAG: hypothetical protein WC475_03650 [Candidatus Paceibacterota bacterium]